jgi:site-specific recombinase XerD
MIKVKFNLRTKEKNKYGKVANNRAIAINMIARWDAKKLVYATKMVVAPQNWNKHTQQVKPVLSEPNYAQINTNLKKLGDAAKKVFLTLDGSNNAVEPHQLKEALDYETGRIRKPYSDPITYIEHFIKEAPKKIDPVTGLKLAENTIKKYKGTQNLVNEFAKTLGKPLSFDNLDKAFFDSLRAYMVNNKGYGPATVAKHMTVLKTMLREAELSDLKINPAFKSRAASSQSGESGFAVYLNEADLVKLNDVYLTGTPDRVRDLLLVGCYTGARFSDWGNLNKALSANGKLTYHAQKTGAKSVVTVIPELQKIMNKYGGKFPVMMTNQQFNRDVKQICKDAGVTDQVQFTEVREGRRVTVTQEKWELVSSHTGRRSFATNEYIKGTPTISIMAVTGHRSERAFLGYLRLSKEEHAEIQARRISEIEELKQLRNKLIAV